uniref:protein mono-ADP-ribosyltransferase PARP9 isoform X8 n=1 Tax=Halichoerus grypus TaxID=9711 RepID=UPI0016594709|nr:protein mono-ADP-ribosyltransferase PARP9 isoform X8 [Halichoerus grypus]
MALGVGLRGRWGRAAPRSPGPQSFSFAFSEIPPRARHSRSPLLSGALPAAAGPLFSFSEPPLRFQPEPLCKGWKVNSNNSSKNNVCIFTSEIENYSRSRQPYLGITVYIGKRKTEFKRLKTPGTWRMDFSELKNGSSRAAAYNEKSETATPEEDHSWQIPINHNDFTILKTNESQLCEVLQNKFDCICTLVSPSLEGNGESQQVFRDVLIPGLELSVWKDDLTRHAVDAVVNAANEDLIHAGGLAKALVNAGGFEIQEESRRLVSRRGKIPTGNIATTKAGRLPCKLIIHAVGPRWTAKYYQTCTHQLQEVIINILSYVTFINPDIETVAIPALSSGIFQFPLDLCTQIIVETISFYYREKQPATNLKEIHLVSNEHPTVAAFKNASEVILRMNKLGSRMSQEATPPFKTIIVNNVTLQIVQGYIQLQEAFSAEVAERKTKLRDFNNYSVPQLTREEKRENGLKAKSPAISLMGSNLEKMKEAQAWIQRILTPQDHHIIENNHILYLGKKEHDILTQLQNTLRVSISEIISLEKAILEIKGAQADVIEVVMNIELMLCEVQEEMARKKELALWSLSGQWTDWQPQNQDEMKRNKFLRCLKLSAEEIQDQKKQFENCGLQVIKVEKIDNVVLMAVFQKKKKMMEGRTHGKPVSHRLFQQIPYQFCEAVCRVGFQRMYSAPRDPKYGVGIYFTKNLKNLAYQVKKTSAVDELIYVFDAEVLTGSFCQGHQLHIVAPPLSPGDTDCHDSVVDNVSSPETFVIFSNTQAMPQYLWTCTQNHVQPRNYSSGPRMNPGARFSGGSAVD